MANLPQKLSRDSLVYIRRESPFGTYAAWILLIALVPFGLILLLRGWNGTFSSGEAFLFLGGVTIAAVGENLIELKKNHYFDGLWESLKKGDLDDLSLRLSVLFQNQEKWYYAPAAVILAFSIFFARQQPHAANPTTSYFQVAIFFAAIVVLPTVRFVVIPGVTNLVDALPALGSFSNRTRAQRDAGGPMRPEPPAT